MSLGIILGTGAPSLQKSQDIPTEYGTARIGTIEFGGKTLYAVARHAKGEVPHLVPNRANMLMLRDKGVTSVLAVSATGRISEDVEPGHLVTPDEIVLRGVDEGQLTYTDQGFISHPFTPLVSSDLRERIGASWTNVAERVQELYDGSALAVGFHREGVYNTINGPSFKGALEETLYRNELAAAGRESGIVIGMTAREAYCARELGMEYAVVAVCTDWSSTPPADHTPVSHEEVVRAMQKTGRAAYLLLDNVIQGLPCDYKGNAPWPMRKEDVKLREMPGGKLKEVLKKHLPFTSF